jgi:hypothetical protein
MAGPLFHFSVVTSESNLWWLPAPPGFIQRFLYKATRQEIENITDQIRVLDEYIDFGAEKLKSWHSNFRPLVDNLWVPLRNLNVKHSGKTAI